MGIAAVKHYLQELSKHYIAGLILELLEFVANQNYIWFNDQFYSQKCGVAMGDKYAPNLANLFMAIWEEGVVYTDRSPHLTFWARYIDDVLLLWEGTISQLDEFFLYLTTMIGESSSKRNQFLGLDHI